MTIFQIIKSQFQFLQRDFNFEIVNEETTGFFALDYQFKIVSYINNFVQIEIGKGEGLSGSSIALEIRKLKNGIPVEYNHSEGAINLEELIKLTQETNNRKDEILISDFERLANLLKINMKFLTTKEWFKEDRIKKIKINTRVLRNERIVEIEKLNRAYLNSKGFKFLKSNDTISSFEFWDGPFIIFSNGTEKLIVKDETDFRDNYFYFHIHLTNKKMKAVSKFEIEKIGNEIKALVQ